MHFDSSILDAILEDAEALTPKISDPPRLSFSYSYTVGVDLARMRDKSVITTVGTKTFGKKMLHILLDIQILNQGLDLIKQAEAIAGYMDKPHFRTWPTKLLVDNSGLGIGVCDLLQAEHQLKFRRITITPGESKSGNRYSRNWLIRNVIKWIGKPDCFVSTDVTHTDELKEQILSLKVDHRKDGTQYFEAGENDDLVMSLALCLAHLESKSRIRSGTTDFMLAAGDAN